MNATMTEAFERHSKKIYGTRPVPIDTITHFCAGWKAAVEASAKKAIDNGDLLEIHSTRIVDAIRTLGTG
jgi:hypothetical protein